jgi:RNA polymerase sigma-70 factor, ECF subfamily
MEPAGDVEGAGVIDRSALDRMMAAAADGDRAAVAPLFHALWPIALGYATRLVGDRSLAEDCAQDAMIQLFGQIARYDRERDALTWALTLLTWQCRTQRRRRARRGELGASAARGARRGEVGASAAGERGGAGSSSGPGGDAALDGAMGGPAGDAVDGASLVEHRDLVRAALAALDALSPRDIETIASAVTDHPREAIAPATFRKRLERALARFRSSWRSRHGTL